MNSVNLTGRLTRDVELQTTQGDKMTAKFTLAVDNFKKDDTNFIMCRAWDKTAQSLANYMHKGSQIGVFGNIRTYRYEKNGQTVYGYEVVADRIEFLDSRNADNDNNYRQNRNNNGYRNNNQGQYNNAHGYQNNNQNNNQQRPNQPNDYEIPSIDDEDLPF